MENASKALLMAVAILVGVLIIALMVSLIFSSKQMTATYEDIKKEEAVEQFNVNFMKYLGRKLTIHEAITICNFSKANGVLCTPDNLVIDDTNYTNSDYELIIAKYDETGKISQIKLTQY